MRLLLVLSPDPLKTFPPEILAQGATDFPLVSLNLKLSYYLVNPGPVIFQYSSGYYSANTAQVVAWYLPGQYLTKPGWYYTSYYLFWLRKMALARPIPSRFSPVLARQVPSDNLGGIG